jgi:hypothetical protein
MSEIDSIYPFVFEIGERVRAKSDGKVFVIQSRQRFFTVDDVNCYGYRNGQGLEYYRQSDLERVPMREWSAV